MLPIANEPNSTMGSSGLSLNEHFPTQHQAATLCDRQNYRIGNLRRQKRLLSETVRIMSMELRGAKS